MPQVVQMVSCYYNPDLPQRTRFRISGDAIECVYSNGTWTARFLVITDAQTDIERGAVCVLLNEWLANR